MTIENEEIGVGKEVLSYCGKCKLALAHIILDMKDEKKIGKCQCKTCSARHNYRNPTAVTKKRTVTKRTPKIPIGETWEKAVAQTDGNAKPYAMDKSFATGQLIDHESFGQGVVMQQVRTDRIQVQFESALKLLVCAQ